MRKIAILLFGCLCLSFVGCQSEIIDWQPGTDKDAPGIVTNVTVENLPGAAKLTYDLPNDKDLAFVEAVYKINGKEQRTSASVYTNTLTVVGFGSTDPQNIQLYCVDRSGNYSSKVDVVANPTTPPVYAILESMKMEAAFGGISVKWDNPSESNISLGILAPDADGFLKEIETVYSSSANGSFKLRGLEAEPATFGVYVRDRWNNLSDTLYTELTPLFETKLDGKIIKYLRLPRDEDGASGCSSLFDGNPGKGLYTSVEVSLSPVFLTFDLGKPAVISRYKLWHRTANPYNNCSPKLWKLYGSLTEPDGTKTTEYWVNEYQADWELLSDVYSVALYKPSGSDIQNTDDDLDAAKAGFDLECASLAPVRFIRFEISENWAMPVRSVIGELEFYGSYVEE